MAKDHLNYDQLGLTHPRIKSLTPHKPTRDLLGHVLEHSPTPVIGRYTGAGHIQLFFKGDGVVVIPSTPRDNRSLNNSESQIRKSLASHGFDFPKRNQVSKKKKDEPEEPPAE